jgi:DNA-binding transcriptional ArsR family regulator
MEKNPETESLEEAIFKTLSHQKRRDILRVIGESKQATFTEIKNAIQTEDTPSLSYHLNALNGLIIQKNGRYRLSTLGQDAYGLICKATTCTAANSLISRLQKELPLLIVANALLWAVALLTVSQFEGRLHRITVLTFAALWLTSNLVLYGLSLRMRNTCSYQR